jgi:hypothetical protein
MGKSLRNVAMSDYTIEAIIKSGVITYKDEGGNMGPNKKVKPGKTISWMSHSGDIEIRFPHGDPFVKPAPPFKAKKDQRTPDATLGKCPDDTHFKYTVIVTDPKSGKPIPPTPDDPQIIIDNSLEGLSFRLSDDLDQLGVHAGKAWLGLINELTEAKGLKRDPDGLFFPGGITSIEVQVSAPLGINVSITVSGPDATVLSSSHTDKK